MRFYEAFIDNCVPGKQPALISIKGSSSCLFHCHILLMQGGRRAHCSGPYSAIFFKSSEAGELKY